MKIHAGQRWVFTSAHDTMRSEVYIIAYDPATHTASMIGLGDGNRWSSTIEAEDPMDISAVEFVMLCGTTSGTFSLYEERPRRAYHMGDRFVEHKGPGEGSIYILSVIAMKDGDGIVGLVDTTTGNVAATIRVPWAEVKDNNFGLGINAFNQLTSSLSVTHLPNKLC